MRVLQAAVIAMGVLILGGTAAVVAIIVHRAGAPRPAALPGTAAVLLDEPAGSRIAASALAGERLLLQLAGGGPDRAVVVDLRSGAIVARVGLAR